MARCSSYAFALAIALTLAAQARPSECDAPAASPSLTIPLPSSPFAVTPTRDGCWIFVSLTGNGGTGAGIAVLKRSRGIIQLSRVVPLKSAPTGITLTHDRRLLVAAATNATIFIDVPRMIGGAADPVLGSFSDGRATGSIYANITRNDKLLFVSEESGQSVTVIDLKRARKKGYTTDAIIGKIPAGSAPIALTFSRNGKWLYTTSQAALPDWNWPKACKPEAPGIPDSIITRPEGAVIVIDVARARKDPAHAVVARVPAGCSPVRMAISPDGDRIYVTARNSNAVLAFDTAKLLSDAGHAQVGIAPVGDAPVPVTVVDNGQKVIAGNSNRFAAGNAPQTLVVLDAGKISEGLNAVLGVIPVGVFPREMAVSADRRTLFLTNFGSKTLQVLDIAHLPIDTNLPPEIAANAAALAHRSERREITVDGKILNGYTGVYQTPDGPALLIALNGNQLTAKIGMQPEMNILPESDTMFFLRPGMQIEFPKIDAGQGNADQVILHQTGRDITAKRLDDAAAKPFLDAGSAFAKRLKNQTPAPGSEAAMRKMIEDLQLGKPDSDLMNADSFAALRRELERLPTPIAQLGSLQSVTFTEVGPGGADIYHVKFEKGSLDYRIWLGPDGKIEGNSSGGQSCCGSNEGAAA